METNWMGRYRPLIAAIYFHSNNNARNMHIRVPMLGGIALNSQEWQTLEYLLEHESEDSNMRQISENLGIPQSSLSKAVKTLSVHGLVKRYHLGKNKKNIILRTTPLARELYNNFVPQMMDHGMGDFFEKLKDIDDDTLKTLTDAIVLFSRGSAKHTESFELIPLDRSDINE